MSQDSATPLPPNLSNSSKESTSTSQDHPAPHDQNNLPTHHTHDVKLHRDAMQFFVTTENHLYDSRRVELGENAWQCQGKMNDESIQALVKAAENKGEKSHAETGSAPVAPAFQHKGQRLGTGEARLNN
ncbi:hypothetical protein BFJ63_vAg17875 [Fusarium oxysporum f. sp. narcissi]|uniref:Uncharacterized protein n=1 Tax=Fusarium oxysporum f. sp. narcissi TaxID=451672 RepID=A0A4Q2V3S8_FUSOX|nr:hypothetical protein BFJ63_vAg17875 [Fusarium oxysporum f. sp. narcissi]